MREALDFGKESTLQEGFDRGFSEAARDAFRFSVLRGALRFDPHCCFMLIVDADGTVVCVVVVSVAHACALTSELNESQREELVVCMEKLRVRSLRVPKVALTDVESLAVDDAAQSAETVATQQSQPTQPTEEEDTELLTTASAWLTRLGLTVPPLA